MAIWPPSLRPNQRRDWLDAITTDCEKRVRITVTNRSWTPLGSVTVRPTSLQTTIDTSADTDRRLDVTGVESGDLLEQSSARLWHVEILHTIPGVGWVESPVGVFVPNRVTRRGREIDASLPDIEAMWAVNLPRNHFGAIDKGVPPLKAARDLLYAMGVRSFRFPAAQLRESNGKGGTKRVVTTKRWAYGGDDVEARPITVIQRMLATHGVQFYFDGAGNATARPIAQQPVYDIDPWLLSDSLPQETTEWLKAYNRVVVQSGEGKKAMYGRAALPDWHPASADKRAVNGVDIPHTLYLTSESRKQAVLNDIARRTMQRQIDASREVSATCLPLPLDPLDRVRVTTASGPITAPVRQASIDWLGDQGMEIGVSRAMRVRRPKKTARRRR